VELTIEEIRQRIMADSELKDLAIAGSDGDISRRMTVESQGPQLTIDGMIDMLSDESAAKLAGNPNLCDLRDKVLAKDMAGIELWVKIFARGGYITPEELAGFQQVMQAVSQGDGSVVVTLDQVNKALRPHRIDGKAGAANWREEI